MTTTWPQRRHRGETPDERLDRNWAELLQELRVAQTGVQILTGFLLTLPFSQRFTELADYQRIVYLAVLSGSVLATGLLVAPVAFHRVLFRHGLRTFIVSYAHRCAQAGLAALALTILGVVWFVFDIVVGQREATIAGGIALVFFAVLWALVPKLLPRLVPPDPDLVEGEDDGEDDDPPADRDDGAEPGREDGEVSRGRAARRR